MCGAGRSFQKLPRVPSARPKSAGVSNQNKEPEIPILLRQISAEHKAGRLSLDQKIDLQTKLLSGSWPRQPNDLIVNL
jgi:hypothetical protein